MKWKDPDRERAKLYHLWKKRTWNTFLWSQSKSKLIEILKKFFSWNQQPHWGCLNVKPHFKNILWNQFTVYRFWIVKGLFDGIFAKRIIFADIVKIFPEHYFFVKPKWRLKRGFLWIRVTEWKKNCQINYLVISLVTPLLSRNFCEMNLREATNSNWMSRMSKIVWNRIYSFFKSCFHEIFAKIE